jgi:hypothetical protein
MRLASITAVALALSTSVALAQATPSPGGANPMPGGLAGPSPTAAPQHIPAVNPLTTENVSNITGTAVYGSDDKKVGTVAHELMTPESKTINRLVVAEGGVLGIGSHDVALPIGQFKWDQDKEGFTIDKTADDLKSMPAWQDPSRQAMAEPTSTHQ